MVADGSFDPLGYHVKRPAINVVRSDIPKPDELDMYKPYIPYWEFPSAVWREICHEHKLE